MKCHRPLWWLSIPAALAAPALESRALDAPAAIGDWGLLGCYIDIEGRSLRGAAMNSAEMTNALCTSFCEDGGFAYAGTEYAGECYCGNALRQGGDPVEDDAQAEADCSMKCSGTASEVCGGPNRLTLYHNPNVQGPSVNPGVDGYHSLGCYAEGTNGRTLTYGSGAVASADMTVALCIGACKTAGYTMAGLEYGGECWCGNAFANGGAPADSGCDMLCNGNKTEYCGGPSRLNVYGSEEVDVEETTTATGETATATATNTQATETSAEASEVAALPTGWSHQGCWIDNANGRILTHALPNDADMTLTSCARACSDAGYTVAGAEYHNECYCGNSIVNGGVMADDDADCNTACAGDATQMCGGPNRMTILSQGKPNVSRAPEPQKSGLPGWTYQGCYADPVVNGRHVLPWQIIDKQMTPKFCLDRCAEFGYMAAGIEYGEECYCGDPADLAGREDAGKQPEADCNMVCPGNGSYICGAGSRLTTYYWTDEEPLYQWSFPQEPEEAGAYEFLIGGVVVPLVTHETITGKVTFLEKWGTGPPNSTGAYELDLALLDDFAAAWRPMHVKTDIFCSASVTLPDKAGRQLNVGGWSADSLQGIRLYWPDGEPGTWGTNDWEENVNELKLQVGRWYPTAMVMANGSVLVIGGEDGSNGAPVPSLEILPATGTPPLYLEWLERTDPNNLYPFLAVLPGGGIFVAYWNEARILDEVTLDTLRTLPNIPGAVNDPTGGRTYPLEGTGVLLPQHAPYTDPLGVLLCGGSTIGTANGLDNCVTIYPDAEDPEWVLERMPSPRVMSCMAPLPDGTYLINNGAKKGVAGFGLAEDPNLNAVLYDPAKPVGQRMTVMANTTVARMYHSESITLLDGTVLVSGSDPEDTRFPQEYRNEVFKPPYLLSGKPRPTFTLADRDWAYGDAVTFTLGAAARNGDIQVSLLGSVGSTHGNSMGARTLFPAVTCTSGTTCTVTAPPSVHICPPGWYQFFVLDGGIPAVGVYVRIGGDPAELGNWPQGDDFSRPGL